MRVDLYSQGGYAGGGITENGGNISGALLLAGNPSQTLEAVPKQYVDAYYNSINASNLTSGTLASTRLPAFNGDLQSSEGTNSLILKNSGITPGSYPKVTVNSKGIVTAGSNISDADIPYGLDWSKINSNSLPNTLSGYGITDGVSINGGTMIGFLSLSQAAANNTQAVSKQYVDSLVSSGGISVGDILRKPYSTTPAGFLRCNGAEISKTTYADLYAVIGDQYNQNSQAGSGKPWQQQYQINITQSENISTWTAATALPGVLVYSQAVVTKNRVYLLGGYNGTSSLATVYTAPINEDGTLGAWTTGTSLPAAVSSAQAIVIKNRVYLMGGSNSVYSAFINSDGTLGTWITETNLPGILNGCQAVVTKNRVYLLGGSNGSVQVATVYTAPINSDGSLGTWTTGTNLPGNLGSSQAVVTKNRVYLLGGYSANNSYTSIIYTAPINNDGTLGTWTTNGNLPGVLVLSQAVVTKNRVYLLTGHNGGTYVATVYTAPINEDGTLGSWTTGTSLPGALGMSQVIVTKNRIYLMSGFNGGAWVDTVYTAVINGGMNDYSSYYATDAINYMSSGSGKPWQQQYQFNTTQSNAISGWGVDSSTLPGGLFHSQVIVTKNRVYTLGGVYGSVLSTVYTAPINADGTLGTWTTATSLPAPVGYSQAIVTKNRVYLLGGRNSAALATVYTAPINADGTLGTWTSGTDLPVAYQYGQAIVTKNRVYILAGNYSTNTYTAPINADGTLGAWTAGTSLPGNLGHSQVIVTKNRVYTLGGYNGGSYISAVYTATINSDGIIGTWTTSTSLPAARGYTQAFVTNNTVYLIGGYTASSVYIAPIDQDGNIGTWSLSTALPTAMYSMCVFSTKNKIYLLGVNSTAIYSATIAADIQDYSPYYDGSIVPNELPDNTDKFLLPDLTADDPFGSYSYIKY